MKSTRLLPLGLPALVVVLAASAGQRNFARADPASPSARILGRGAPGVVSAERVSVVAAFSGPGRIVRFENLPPGAPRLAIFDRREAYELWSDPSGVLEVAGPATPGPHTIEIMPPDQTRLITYLPPASHARARSRGRRAAALLLLASVALWAAWGSGRLPERIAPPEHARRPLSVGRAAGLAAGLAFAGAIVFYAVRVWRSPLARHPPAIEKIDALYRRSQFVVGWKQPGLQVMTDQGIYVWAGWLLAHGTRPDLVNPEHPPAGKYALGAAQRLTGFPAAATFAAGLIALAGLAVLGRGVLNSWPLALLAASLTAAGPLLTSYTEHTYIEIFLLAAAAWGIAAAGRFAGAPKTPLAAILGLDLVLGAGLAVKWSFAAFAVAVLAVLLRAGKVRSSAAFLAGLPLAAAVYSLSYVRGFVQGVSPTDFLAFQWAVATRWKLVNASASRSLFGLWRILFVGIPDYSPARLPHWSIEWPVVGALALAGAVLAFRRGGPYAVACAAWFLGEMLFFTDAPTWERYLVPILPVASILAVFVVVPLARRAPRGAIAR